MIETGRIQVASSAGIYVLKFVGDVRLNLCSTLDSYVEKMMADEHYQTSVLDLTEADCVDSTTLGQMAKISILAQERYGQKPTIVSTQPDIDRILSSMGFEQVFFIVHELISRVEQLEELPVIQESEDEVKEKVLEAHKLLMNLNHDNEEAFKDLVNSLEKPADKH